jgi:ATP-binding cassette subfamily F protein 3
MLNLANISKIHGGEVLYSNVSFQINPGEKVGLVGANGTGKTTLFRMIIGEESPTEGTISFPDKMRLAYFSQNVGEMKGKSALQEVIEGDDKVRALKAKLLDYEKRLEDYGSLTDDQMNDIMSKMGDVQTEFESVGGYELESRAQEILTGLGIPPEDHQKPTQDFSGGWKMRIALAKVLVRMPDLIVMDEPTNYLDLETILWVETWLQNFKGAIFMTTHDREFMNKVCKKIVEVSNSQITVYSGNYDYYLRERGVRMEQLKAAHARQAETLAKEEEFIARFKARASHAAQVQSRVKNLDKIERIEIPAEEAAIDFEFPVPPRGSDDVVIMNNLAKSWTNSEGQPRPIFDHLTTTIKRTDKIAVVGVNGAGKSTLLKVIASKTEATSGQIKLGPSIKLGYFGQFTLEVLNPQNTVFDEARGNLSDPSDAYIRNLLAAFLFRGDDVKKQIRHLSGGEKARLILAILLAQHNNLLVLDEPTNHLDIKSREILLEALKKFEGTVIIVSHDRHFLRELSQKVYEVDKKGITIYPGNYQYYLDKKALGH